MFKFKGISSEDMQVIIEEEDYKLWHVKKIKGLLKLP